MSDKMHHGTNHNIFWREAAEIIDEDDATLRQIVEKAELPPLLAALAAATGDTTGLSSALRPPLTPVDTEGHPHGGMDPHQQAAAKTLAVAGLRKLREQKITGAESLPKHIKTTIFEYLTNGRSEWSDMLDHELNLGRDDGDPAPWHFDDVVKDRKFSVLIVGAGIAGIAAAYRFSQAGVPFTIIEATDRLGGTWNKNRYPGVRLDTPTFGYSYSFAQRGDWPHQFAEGHEIQEYLETVSQQSGLFEKVEYGKRLVSARWDEESGTWEATTVDHSNVPQIRAFNAIISATGQLDIPQIPDFPGQESFRGTAMHSQEWDPTVDLTGKRVAVIGTGASAYQIVPSVVDSVESMVVFQRSAPWMLPAPNYHESVTETFSWLIRKVPHFARWFRLWVFILGIPGRFHTVRAEENWVEAPLSVSEKNQEVRDRLISILEQQFADDPEMLQHAIPNYPPGAKRMLRDNGVWAGALTDEKTTLETSPIHQMTPDGVVTQDGVEHEVDVIIYATGFRPSDYLEGIDVVGRNGQEIHQFWDGDARAYNGVTVPGFPNFFMIYGPNVGGVVAGSLHFMLERASEYSLSVVRHILEHDLKALDVKPSALQRFVDWVDEENEQMAWGQPYVRSWYKNRKGRVSQIWPYTNHEYWEITKSVQLEDYDFLFWNSDTSIGIYELAGVSSAYKSAVSK